MQIHHKKEHCDLAAPTRWKSCKAQHLKEQGTGALRTFWEVIPDKITQDPTQALMEELMESLNKELHTVQAPVDRCLVSPWLLTTGWHVYMESMNLPMDVLRQMVSLPHSHELQHQTLLTAIELYFQEGVALINSTDERVLQRLNSPDPAKK